MSVSMEKARIDHQVLTPIFSRTEPDRNTLAEYQIHLATFFGISVPECLGRCVGTHPEKLWVKIPNYFCLSAYKLLSIARTPLGTTVQSIEQILLILAGRRRRVKTDQIRRGEGTAVQLGRQASPEAL